MSAAPTASRASREGAVASAQGQRGRCHVRGSSPGPGTEDHRALQLDPSHSNPAGRSLKKVRSQKHHRTGPWLPPHPAAPS